MQEAYKMWNSMDNGRKSEELLYWQYDLRKCVYWIIFHKFQKVCLQFPDELLIDAADIASLLEKEVGQKIYIMADTTFGSCCVDFVAAKHVHADSIIHFGRACLTSQDSIPTLYVFPKIPFDVRLFCKSAIKFCAGLPSKLCVTVLFDVGFNYAVDDMIAEFAILRGQIRLSRLATPQQKKEGLKWALNDILVTKCGRVFSVPCTENLDCLAFIYLSDKYCRKNLDNFVSLYPNSQFYYYEAQNPRPLELYRTPEITKRRLFLIQKIKEVRNIGILISTLSTEKYMDAIERVKELCRLRNKKSYVISVGKINVAKLANFPDIHVFVMISCPETETPTEQDYYQPIVTVMDIELALNNNDVWWQNNISDFREFLPGGKVYKEIDRNTDVLCGVDISLLGRNQALSGNLVDTEMADAGHTTMAVRDPMTITGTSINDGLAGRSWQGLQLNLNDTPIERVATGLLGTPSGGYHYPSSSGLT